MKRSARSISGRYPLAMAATLATIARRGEVRGGAAEQLLGARLHDDFPAGAHSARAAMPMRSVKSPREAQLYFRPRAVA